jgi:hypothetical protein
MQNRCRLDIGGQPRASAASTAMRGRMRGGGVAKLVRACQPPHQFGARRKQLIWRTGSKVRN